MIEKTTGECTIYSQLWYNKVSITTLIVTFDGHSSMTTPALQSCIILTFNSLIVLAADSLSDCSQTSTPSANFTYKSYIIIIKYRIMSQVKQICTDFSLFYFCLAVGSLDMYQEGIVQISLMNLTLHIFLYLSSSVFRSLGIFRRVIHVVAVGYILDLVIFIRFIRIISSILTIM